MDIYIDCLFSSRKSKRRFGKKYSTCRNIKQKEKQNDDKLTRNHRKQERNQKSIVETPRTYYCRTCKRQNHEPCNCNYTQWCGKECDWDKCQESYRIGISEQLVMPYDVLCGYHSIRYAEQLTE
jgi:hypothetical protein